MSDENKYTETHTDGDLFTKVQTAIRTADYTELSDMIAASVDKALKQTKQGIKTGQYQMEKAIRAAKVQATNKTPTGRTKKTAPDPLDLPAPLPKNPTGTFSGPLATAGAVGLIGVGGIIVISSLVGSLALTPLIIGGLIIVGGIAQFFKSKSIRDRVTRFKQYVATLKGRHHIEIASLSADSGKSEKYIQKDVRKMIDKGMFPEGHLSDDGKTLILSNAAYTHYLNLQKAQKEKEAEEVRRQQKMAEDPLYGEVYQVMTEGEKALDQIHHAKGRIPGQTVSKKIERLERVIRRIFDRIEAHPEQVSSVRRFMSYYLPTTVKLVTAYADLDAEPVQGENITKSKNEIEASLDTISNAFEKLADSLYEDDVMDISSDIEVMKTMMARDGLTD